MTKKMMYMGMFIGMALGGYVPSLWGSPSVSMSTVVGIGMGAIVGLWAGYRIARG